MTGDGWTTDDLDTVPEDGIRRELLDGVLLVSPTSTDVHQIIAGRLLVALEQTCPPDLQVTQGVEVRINSRRAFIPDSPTSTSMDRITEPAPYAAAGIPPLPSSILDLWCPVRRCTRPWGGTTTPRSTEDGARSGP